MSSTSAVQAGRAYVEVYLRDRIDAGARVIQQRLRALANNFRDLGVGVSVAGGTLTAAFGSLFTGLVFPTKFAAELESMEAQFTTLTGSMRKAREIVSELRKVAAATPFGIAGLSKAASTLLSFGITGNDVVGKIKTLGDVAQGNQERLERLAIAFGQVQGKSRLMAQEVNQMVENGFNPLQEISRTTGRSMRELFKTMEDGEVSFAMVDNAFRTATSSGGRFFGSLTRQAATTRGIFDQFREAVRLAVQPIGDVLLPILKDFLIRATQIVREIGKWTEANKQLVPALTVVAAVGTAVGGAILVLGTALIGVSTVLTSIRVLVQGAAFSFRVFTRFSTTANQALGATSSQSTLAATALNNMRASAAAAAASAARFASTNRLVVVTITTAITRSMAYARALAILSQVLNVTIPLLQLVNRTNRLVAASSLAVGRAMTSSTKSTARATAAWVAYTRAANAAAATAARAAAAAQAASAAGATGSGRRSRRSARGGANALTPAFANTGTSLATTSNAMTVLGTSMTRATGSTVTFSNGVVGLIGVSQNASSAVRGLSLATIMATTATTTAAAQTTLWSRVLLAARAGIGSLGSGIGGVLTAIGGFLTGTVAGVVLLIGAIAAGLTYLYYRTGKLQQALNYIVNAGSRMAAFTKRVFTGITTALSSGEYKLAAQILFAALKVAFLTGTQELLIIMKEWVMNIHNTIIDMGLALRDTIWDIFSSIPAIIKAALSGTQSVLEIISDIFTGNLEKRGGFFGRSIEDAQKELDALLAKTDAIALKKQKQSASDDPRANTTAKPIPDLTEDEKLKLEAQADVQKQAAETEKEQREAALKRIQAISDEIAEMKLGKDALELMQAAREGANRQELDAIALLQRRRLALQQQQKAEEEAKAAADERRKQLIDDGKALTDATRTPLEKYQADMQRIQSLQQAGTITQETAARAMVNAVDELTSAAQKEFVPNTVAGRGTDEAQMTIDASRQRLLKQAQFANAQRLAQQNARNRVAGAVQKSQEQIAKEQAEQERLELARNQLGAMRQIAANTAKPKEVVSIR